MPPESACAAIAINADISFAGRRNGEVRPRMEPLARQRQALEIQGNLLALCATDERCFGPLCDKATPAFFGASQSVRFVRVVNQEGLRTQW